MKLQHAYLVCGGLMIATALVGGLAVVGLPPGQSVSAAVAAAHPPGHAPRTSVMGIPTVICPLFAVAAAAWQSADRKWGLADSATAFGCGLIGVFAIFLVAQAAVVDLTLDPAFHGDVWLLLAVGVALATAWFVIGALRRRSASGVASPEPPGRG